MEDYTVIKQLAKGGQGATMLVKHNDGSANMVLKQCKVCVEERRLDEYMYTRHRRTYCNSHRHRHKYARHGRTVSDL